MFCDYFCEVIFLVGSNFFFMGSIQIFLNKKEIFLKKVVGSADPTPPSLPPPLQKMIHDLLPTPAI